MRKELDEKLVKDFPEIFRDRNGDMKATAMCWGFECGDGWFDLIYNLCKMLQFSVTRVVGEESNQIVASQVKEKYGTLRFYVWGSTDYQDGLISMAEHLSAHICEMCGVWHNEDLGIDSRWYSSLCTECRKKFN